MVENCLNFSEKSGKSLGIFDFLMSGNPVHVLFYCPNAVTVKPLPWDISTNNSSLSSYTVILLKKFCFSDLLFLKEFLMTLQPMMGMVLFLTLTLLLPYPKKFMYFYHRKKQELPWILLIAWKALLEKLTMDTGTQCYKLFNLLNYQTRNLLTCMNRYGFFMIFSLMESLFLKCNEKEL